MPEIRREIIGREGGTGTHGENGPAIEDKTSNANTRTIELTISP